MKYETTDTRLRIYSNEDPRLRAKKSATWTQPRRTSESKMIWSHTVRTTEAAEGACSLREEDELEGMEEEAMSVCECMCVSVLCTCVRGQLESGRHPRTGVHHVTICYCFFLEALSPLLLPSLTTYITTTAPCTASVLVLHNTLSSWC